MKGVINIKGLIVTIGIIILFGTLLMNLIQDLAYLIACGGCSQASNAIVKDVGSVVTMGQNDVIVGITGLLELKNNPPSNVSPLIMQGMEEGFRRQVWTGSIVTAIYIILFYLLLTKFHDAMGSLYPPYLLVIFAFVIVGVLHWVFTGFTQLPYLGWWELFNNMGVMSNSFIDVVSPVPLNLT